MIRWTEHARQRAKERFPGVDLDAAYEGAGRIGRKTWKKIKARCWWSARIWMTGQFNGRYCRITKDRIVFVMEAPETVVTVFRLEAAAL